MTYDKIQTEIDLRLARHLHQNDAKVKTCRSIFQYLAAQEVSASMDRDGRARSNGQSQWQKLKTRRPTQARDIVAKPQPDVSHTPGRLAAYVKLTRRAALPGGLKPGAWRVFRRHLD